MRQWVSSENAGPFEFTYPDYCVTGSADGMRLMFTPAILTKDGKIIQLNSGVEPGKSACRSYPESIAPPTWPFLSASLSLSCVACRLTCPHSNCRDGLSGKSISILLVQTKHPESKGGKGVLRLCCLAEEICGILQGLCVSLLS